MTARLLIVEDDPAVAQLIKDGLTQAGFRAHIVPGAEEALRSIRDAPPDLLILDIQLGGLSGLELCDLLRRQPATAHLPILLLTSRGSERDRVAGLRTGADDYVVKPFSEPELVARVEALLRRARGRPADIPLHSGDTVLDLERRTVAVRGRPVDLTPLEFDALALLVKMGGRVVPFSKLAAAVWNDRVATRHTITVTLARLRRKMGPAGRRIAPVTGLGYQWRDTPCD